MKKEFLLRQKIGEASISNSLKTEAEIVRYLNMLDCMPSDIEYKIFWFGSELEEVIPCSYAGWQPGCLIEVITDTPEAFKVISAIGEDH